MANVSHEEAAPISPSSRQSMMNKSFREQRTVRFEYVLRQIPQDLKAL
jgi:nicotinamide mononucleotide adenylyltransferase